MLPSRKRRVAAFHGRADRQAGVLPTGPAAQYTRAVLEAKRSANHTTMRADETRIPACLFQVCRAHRVIREKLLKFRQSLRERQIGVLLDVHGGHGCLTYRLRPTINRAELGANRILQPFRQNQPIVGMGANRIGMERIIIGERLHTVHEAFGHLVSVAGDGRHVWSCRSGMLDWPGYKKKVKIRYDRNSPKENLLRGNQTQSSHVGHPSRRRPVVLEG
jgi:hypothetical protein